MSSPTRLCFRRKRTIAPASAERLEKHAEALELLADLVRDLPEDDERLLLLGTLAVRNGQSVPGPAAEHALMHLPPRPSRHATLS